MEDCQILKGVLKMDEMKIKLSSGLIKGLVTKLIAGVIFKKTGYHVDIELDELLLTVVEGEAHVHVNVDAKMDKKDFANAIKQIGLG